MTKASIAALGEALVEFNQVQAGDPTYRQGFGGDTSNAVIAAARNGARCAYLTRIGSDAFGGMLMQLWQREGVDTRAVTVDQNAPTGAYFVTHSEQGHAFSYLRAGSAASLMTAADLHIALLRNVRYLHLSAVSQAISTGACDTAFAAIETARAAGTAISYDPNLRLQLWPLARAKAIIRATIGVSDYFLPSLDDARAFTGLEDAEAILDWCFDAGAHHVLLKLGPQGVIVADRAKRSRVDGFRVEAVDATGAGDCFAGAFLARLAQGDDTLAAARYANAAAALTTTGYGAVAPIPRPEQVHALLA